MLWDRVDEPVLRWVASLLPSRVAGMVELEIRDPTVFEPLPGLSSWDVDDSLHRLRSHDLISGVADLSQTTLWYQLRLTAQGLIALGEWPDLDRVGSAASLHAILRALEEEAPEEERSSLLRAAGVVGRTADGVLRDTAAHVARSAGEEIAG